MIGLALGQLEVVGAIDVACGRQDAVGPQRHAPVSERAGVDHAGVDEAAADAMATHVRLDVEQAKLGHGLRFAGEEDGADDAAFGLGDPGAFPRRVALLHEVGGHARHEDLERRIEPVFLGIQRAVAVDDPADVAGAQIAHGAVSFRIASEKTLHGAQAR